MITRRRLRNKLIYIQRLSNNFVQVLRMNMLLVLRLRDLKYRNPFCASVNPGLYAHTCAYMCVNELRLVTSMMIDTSCSCALSDFLVLSENGNNIVHY